MYTDDFLSPVTYLAGEELSAASARLFWFSAGEKKGCEIIIDPQGRHLQCCLKPGETGMFAVKSKKFIVRSGEVHGVEAQTIAMAKLQAFIDAGSQPVTSGKKKEIIYGFSPCRQPEELSRRKFEYWLIGQSVKKCPGMDNREFR